MRHLLLIVGLLTLLLGQKAYAGQARPNLKNLDQPILLDAGAVKRMEVIFNHSTHKSVKCRICHHMGLPGNRYAPCTNEECHALKGAAERNPMSVYMAYHAPYTDRSCYGCHKSLADKYPAFRGCKPCHQTPQGRKLAAEARQGKASPANNPAQTSIP